MLVAVSLTAVLVAALPALRELARAARSAEKLCDTLNRELPPTLEAIRLTGMEITDLTDDIEEGVKNAGRVAQQVDQSISGVRRQAKQAQVTTRSLFAGVRAAWSTFSRPAPSMTRRVRETPATPPRNVSAGDANGLTPDAYGPGDTIDRLPSHSQNSLDRSENYPTRHRDAYTRSSYLEEADESIENWDEAENSAIIDARNPAKLPRPGLEIDE